MQTSESFSSLHARRSELHMAPPCSATSIRFVNYKVGLSMGKPINAMTKIFEITAAGLLGMTAFSAYAQSDPRVDRLEAEVRDLQLRLSKIEAGQGGFVADQKPESSGSGWKSLSNWRQLKTGMTPEQVRTISGSLAGSRVAASRVGFTPTEVNRGLWTKNCIAGKSRASNAPNPSAETKRSPIDRPAPDTPQQRQAGRAQLCGLRSSLVRPGVLPVEIRGEQQACGLLRKRRCSPESLPR